MPLARKQAQNVMVGIKTAGFLSIAKINYNYMNKGLIPVLAVATVSSIAYLIKKYVTDNSNLLERPKLIDLIITLRKSIFSTLREIAYVANCIKLIDSGIEARKIKDITMRDGATAQAKLQCIEKLILKQFEVSREKFQQSCNFHAYENIEIKLLLQALHNDIQNAIDGTIDPYNGPLPPISGADTIRIHREVTLRRMKIIEQKFLNNLDNIECLGMELQIQRYLESENIRHPKQASQKVFISILEHHYKTDSTFKQEFEHLEKEYQDFIDEIKARKKG